MHLRTLSVAVLLSGAAVPLAAQEEPRSPLDMGDRVRVTFQDEDSARVTGSLLQLTWQSLVIEEPGAAARERGWNAIRLVEVSRGRDRGRAAWKGGTLGAFVGMALGSIAGALLAPELPTNTEETMIAGGIGAGLLGGGFGASVGAVFPRERWEPYVMVREPVLPRTLLAAETAPAAVPAEPAPLPAPVAAPLPQDTVVWQYPAADLVVEDVVAADSAAAGSASVDSVAADPVVVDSAIVEAVAPVPVDSAAPPSAPTPAAAPAVVPAPAPRLEPAGAPEQAPLPSRPVEVEKEKAPAPAPTPVQKPAPAPPL